MSPLVGEIKHMFMGWGPHPDVGKIALLKPYIWTGSNWIDLYSEEGEKFVSGLSGILKCE